MSVEMKIPEYDPDQCNACGNHISIHRATDFACPRRTDGFWVKDWSPDLHFEKPRSRETIFRAIVSERGLQDAKFGEQHWPVKPIDGSWDKAFQDSEAAAKAACSIHTKDGTLTWWHILNEEFMEAMAAKTRKDQIKEMVQLAAVCVHVLENLVEDEAEEARGR